jgi:hypothetical protein
MKRAAALWLIRASTAALCACSCGKEKVTEPKEPSGIASEFTATPTCGQAPLSVEFKAPEADVTTSYRWEFGDGETSTAATVTHTYNSPGIYDVALTVTNAGGTSRKEEAGLIVCTPAKPFAPTIIPNLNSKCGNVTWVWSWEEQDAVPFYRLEVWWAGSGTRISCGRTVVKSIVIGTKYQLAHSGSDCEGIGTLCSASFYKWSVQAGRVPGCGGDTLWGEKSYGNW